MPFNDEVRSARRKLKYGAIDPLDGVTVALT